MWHATNGKFSYLEIRLFIAMIASIIIIIIDLRFHAFLSFKSYIENSICQFYYVLEKPSYMLYYMSDMFSGYKKLFLENNELRKELFYKNNELLLMDQYKQENYKLHTLLNSPLYHNKHKLIAKIFLINTDLSNPQFIINQGLNNHVYVGQPVISDKGVIGQVISVNKITSRILLISDPTHALPVKLKHNDIRMILMGRGYNSELCAEYPGNIDVCTNDILVTSGLDGRFPEGYPVAIVSNIQINSEKDCTIIRAQPIIKPQDLHYAVLIWE